MLPSLVAVILSTAMIALVARAIMGVRRTRHVVPAVAGATAVGILVVLAMMLLIILISLWDGALLPPPAPPPDERRGARPQSGAPSGTGVQRAAAAPAYAAADGPWSARSTSTP